MGKEIKVWGDGKKGLWSFGKSVDIPKKFVEVRTGDHYLTKTIKQLADHVYVRMKKSKKGEYSRAIGIIAPKKVVEEARVLARKTEEARRVKRRSAAEYRARREEKHRAAIKSQMRHVYANIPPDEAEAIVDRAFEVGSGRIGRVSSVDLEKKLELAVKAHIRHQHTCYDDLLLDGWDKEDARREIMFEVEGIHERWRGDPVQQQGVVLSAQGCSRIDH